MQHCWFLSRMRSAMKIGYIDVGLHSCLVASSRMKKSEEARHAGFTIADLVGRSASGEGQELSPCHLLVDLMEHTRVKIVGPPVQAPDQAPADAATLQPVAVVLGSQQV